MRLVFKASTTKIRKDCIYKHNYMNILNFLPVDYLGNFALQLVSAALNIILCLITERIHL